MATENSVPQESPAQQFSKAIEECHTNGYAAEHSKIGCDFTRQINADPEIANAYAHVECWLCMSMCSKNSVQQEHYRRSRGQVAEDAEKALKQFTDDYNAGIANAGTAKGDAS